MTGDETKTQLDRIEKVVGTLAEKTAHIEETVDVLARSVAEGFKKTGEQFEGVSGKIDGVHRRIDAELEKHTALENRVTKIENELSPA